MHDLLWRRQVLIKQISIPAKQCGKDLNES